MLKKFHTCIVSRRAKTHYRCALFPVIKHLLTILHIPYFNRPLQLFVITTVAPAWSSWESEGHIISPLLVAGLNYLSCGAERWEVTANKSVQDTVATISHDRWITIQLGTSYSLGQQKGRTENLLGTHLY